MGSKKRTPARSGLVGLFFLDATAYDRLTFEGNDIAKAALASTDKDGEG